MAYAGGQHRLRPRVHHRRRRRARSCALGMFIFLREATNARNLRDLLPLVNAHTNRRLCFCTDDRHAGRPAGRRAHRLHGARWPSPRASTRSPPSAWPRSTPASTSACTTGARSPRPAAPTWSSSPTCAPCGPSMVYRSGKLVAEDGQVIPWERPRRTAGAAQLDERRLEQADLARSRPTAAACASSASSPTSWSPSNWSRSCPSLPARLVADPGPRYLEDGRHRAPPGHRATSAWALSRASGWQGAPSPARLPTTITTSWSPARTTRVCDRRCRPSVATHGRDGRRRRRRRAGRTAAAHRRPDERPAHRRPCATRWTNCWPLPGDWAHPCTTRSWLSASWRCPSSPLSS